MDDNDGLHRRDSLFSAIVAYAFAAFLIGIILVGVFGAIRATSRSIKLGHWEQVEAERRTAERGNRWNPGGNNRWNPNGN